MGPAASQLVRACSPSIAPSISNLDASAESEVKIIEQSHE